MRDLSSSRRLLNRPVSFLRHNIIIHKNLTVQYSVFDLQVADQLFRYFDCLLVSVKCNLKVWARVSNLKPRLNFSLMRLLGLRNCYEEIKNTSRKITNVKSPVRIIVQKILNLVHKKSQKYLVVHKKGNIAKIIKGMSNLTDFI